MKLVNNMVRLEDTVAKLFSEKPNLTRDEAVEELKKIKDSKTNKCPWHVPTIRNRVDSYLAKKKQPEQKIMLDQSEGTAPESKAEPKTVIEGKELTRRRPDMFEAGMKEMTPLNLNDVIAKQISEMTTPYFTSFQNDMKGILDITISLKDALKHFTEDNENEIRLLREDFDRKLAQVKQGIGLQEETEYDEIELRKSTIDSIKEAMMVEGWDELSDYVDNLQKLSKEYTPHARASIESYKTLVHAVQEAGGKLILDCSLDKDEKLAITVAKLRRKKTLLAGIGIGATIVAVVVYLLMGVFHLISV